MNANPLTTVGLMLTLASLVGSFFNIQLSQWLRDLLALAQKAQLNQAQGNDSQQKAIIECRIEYEKLINRETFIGNAVVVLFVIFVLLDGLNMISAAQLDPLYPNVRLALWVFLVLFIGLSAWQFKGGSNIAQRTKNILK